MIRLLNRSAYGALGSCCAVYLAAVGNFAQVEQEVVWWPYAWLWYLGAAGAIAALAILLTHTLTDTPQKSSPVPVIAPPGASSEGGRCFWSRPMTRRTPA